MNLFPDHKPLLRLSTEMFSALFWPIFIYNARIIFVQELARLLKRYLHVDAFLYDKADRF